jgi:hypothetical protein
MPALAEPPEVAARSTSTTPDGRSSGSVADSARLDQVLPDGVADGGGQAELRNRYTENRLQAHAVGVRELEDPSRRTPPRPPPVC